MPKLRLKGAAATVAASLALAACSTTPPAETSGNERSIAGSWRDRASGLTLSISTFSTFAVKNGCTMTGGVLQPIGGGRYKVDRYDSGFASEECGPWRSGPEIAPLDGTYVSLAREGQWLTVAGAGRQLKLRWVAPPAV